MGLLDEIHDLASGIGGSYDETAPLTLADQEAVGEVALPAEPDALQQLEEQVNDLQARIQNGE